MTHIDETRPPERDAYLWLTVANSGMDVAGMVRELSTEELRAWVEIASEMDIPRERKQTVAKEYNQR